MEFDVRERNGVTIFDIKGKIISADSMRLLDAIQKCIVSAKDDKEVKILLNLAEAPMMNSVGLSVFVATYRFIKQKKGQGRMALLKPGEKAKAMMRMAKLSYFFETYEKEDEAIASFQ